MARVYFAANKWTVEGNAGHASCTAAHEGIENRLAGQGCSFNQPLPLFQRLWAWVVGIAVDVVTIPPTVWPELPLMRIATVK